VTDVNNIVFEIRSNSATYCFCYLSMPQSMTIISIFYPSCVFPDTYIQFNIYIVCILLMPMMTWYRGNMFVLRVHKGRFHVHLSVSMSLSCSEFQLSVSTTI
jgi:hypothetical protein